MSERYIQQPLILTEEQQAELKKVRQREVWVLRGQPANQWREQNGLPITTREEIFAHKAEILEEIKTDPVIFQQYQARSRT